MKSFRLGDATLGRLRWLEALTGASATDLVERAVAELWGREVAETLVRLTPKGSGEFAVEAGKSGRWVQVGAVRRANIDPPGEIPAGEMAALLLLLEARGAEVFISEPGFSKVTLALASQE